MPASSPRSSRFSSWLGASGALCAAAGVALSAYASHAMAGTAQSQLQTAALFAFGHGVALAALSRDSGRRLARIALAILLIGVLLFSGSLATHVLAQWPSTLAPFGGTLVIAGWIVYAIALLRH
jgi:uncharacterized membrane protein YgdD (TMEM256/DUF423 family)